VYFIAMIFFKILRRPLYAASRIWYNTDEPLDGLLTDREPLAMRGRVSSRKVRDPCSIWKQK